MFRIMFYFSNKLVYETTYIALNDLLFDLQYDLKKYVNTSDSFVIKRVGLIYE